jgi:N-acetylglucosaminyldiphosphoundecaprenol N-acetyl-beta-D-mannosaminyltransferase
MEPATVAALPPPRQIAGLPVHPVRLAELNAWIAGALARPERATVFYANVHAVNLAQRDAAFRAAFAQADLVFCDGQGLRIGAALLGQPLPERFTPPDWVDSLAAVCAAQGAGIFLLGGRPGVAELAAARLRARHPGLRTAAHHGFFLASPADEAAAIAALGGFGPGVLLVGLGMPLQERWVAARRDALDAPVVLTVGALFDYLAGTVRRGPRWLTDSGFEWLCRLWYEPRRLWRRYLLGNPAFFLRILRQRLAAGRRAGER